MRRGFKDVPSLKTCWALGQALALLPGVRRFPASIAIWPNISQTSGSKPSLADLHVVDCNQQVLARGNTLKH